MCDKINIMLIGCGPHSKRVYLPAIQEIDVLNISLVVDLKSNRHFVESTTESYKVDEFYYVEEFFDKIPYHIEEYLQKYVQEHNIKAVIIATEPLVHKIYASWALKNGLNILMDKPISTHEDVVSDLGKANRILTDYYELLTDYNRLQSDKETIFLVNSQRRFHKGFELVFNKIHEVAEITNCPITFIQAYHCDGQWRLPSEIVHQIYHPYCLGYGKASHSGYHIFDTVYQILKAGEIKDKFPDRMKINSSFIQPKGFLQQLTEEDYYRYFGEEYDLVKLYSDRDLNTVYNGYGELDISALVSLYKNDQVVCNVNINLLHNGFAGRTWLYPGKDLYKGNGRIKHEHYNIQQGPFQNIQIHSYQAYDNHDDTLGKEDQLGGKNHFDIYIFRNPKISDEYQQPEIIKLSDLTEESDGSIFMENTKFQVVNNFYEYLKGTRKKQDVKSQLEDHLVAVQLMSGIYCSHLQHQVAEEFNINSNYTFGESKTYFNS